MYPFALWHLVPQVDLIDFLAVASNTAVADDVVLILLNDNLSHFPLMLPVADDVAFVVADEVAVVVLFELNYLDNKCVLDLL